MPVGGVARQSRYFQAHHDPGAAHADLGDQALEAFAIDGRRAGLTEVGVDHDDPLERPAERDRALPQVVLPLGALLILEHLAQGRLADVQVRIALEMASFDLRAGLAADPAVTSCVIVRTIVARTSMTSRWWVSGIGTSRSSGAESIVAGATEAHAAIQAAIPCRTKIARPATPSTGRGGPRAASRRRS